MKQTFVLYLSIILMIIMQYFKSVVYLVSIKAYLWLRLFIAMNFLFAAILIALSLVMTLEHVICSFFIRLLLVSLWFFILISADLTLNFLIHFFTEHAILINFRQYYFSRFSVEDWNLHFYYCIHLSKLIHFLIILYYCCLNLLEINIDFSFLLNYHQLVSHDRYFFLLNFIIFLCFLRYFLN